MGGIEMKKHTPKPWTWEKATEGYEGPRGAIIGGDGETVCDFGDNTTYYPTEGCEPDEKDRLLMLAAPDLLEACEKTLAWLESMPPTPPIAWLRAAIAKASEGA
jgi:hypothetical protein